MRTAARRSLSEGASSTEQLNEEKHERDYQKHMDE
jgi:hypothetical protein